MPSNNSDFSTTPYTHRSMRHFSFPRRAPSHGLGHNTLIIIVVSVSVVGGLLLTFFIWRIISRLLRPKSAPLPRRQSLVHQRELQLVAFNEYKDAIVPQIFTNDSGVHGSDETTLDSPYGIQLHPPSPQFFPPPTPPMGSVSSLLSSNDDSSPSSSVATPHTQFSTSAPANQSSRRGTNHSGPRPLSTFSTSSRQSVRGAPHAPHNNVQIILPAPLAPNLYQGTASDGSLFPFPRALTRDSTYSVRDSWRRSLADSWILVGQDSLADSELMEQQYGHDSMKRPSRLMRSMFVTFSMNFLFT